MSHRSAPTGDYVSFFFVGFALFLFGIFLMVKPEVIAESENNTWWSSNFLSNKEKEITFLRLTGIRIIGAVAVWMAGMLLLKMFGVIIADPK